MRVHPVRFVGNVTMPSNELRLPFKHLEELELPWPTNAPSILSEVLAVDTIDLRSLLNDQGFLDATITDTAFVPSADRRWVETTITLREGPRYRLGKLVVREKGGAPDATLRHMVPLSTGDWLSRGAIRKGISEITASYATSGVGASVETLPVTTGGTVDLTLEVVRHPSVDRIADIQMDGVSPPHEREVARALRLHAGDRVDWELLEEARQRALDLDRFAYVLVTMAEDGSGTHVLVRAREMDDTRPP